MDASVVIEWLNPPRANSSSMPRLRDDIHRLNEGRRCWHCERPAALYGFRNVETGALGWCFMCQRHYKQNDVDWTLRCYNWPLLDIGDVRQRIVLFMVGSLTSVERQMAQRKIWDRILGRGNITYYVNWIEPDSESDEEYQYIERESGIDFDARGFKSFINPLDKLRIGGALNCSALSLVVEFLGSFQMKTRKR